MTQNNGINKRNKENLCSRKDKIYSFLDFKRSFNIRNRGSDVV
jgi:hypothetical protein